MNRETVEPVEDLPLPEGFRVTFHTLVGHNVTDRWYEAFRPDGSKIGNFNCQDAALHACIGHASTEPPPPPEDDSIESTWKNVLGRHPDGCIRCKKTINQDGTRVTWRCAHCGHKVCRECTRQVFPGEYHAMTLCSDACWEAVGRPDD